MQLVKSAIRSSCRSVCLKDLRDVLQVSSIHQSVNSWQNCGETQAGSTQTFSTPLWFPALCSAAGLHTVKLLLGGDFPLARCRQNNTPVSKQSQTSAAGEHSAYGCSALVCSCLLIPTVSPSHLLSPSLTRSLHSAAVSLSSLSHFPVGSDFEAGTLGWQIDLLQTDDGPLQEYSEPGVFKGPNSPSKCCL